MRRGDKGRLQAPFVRSLLRVPNGVTPEVSRFKQGTDGDWRASDTNAGFLRNARYPQQLECELRGDCGLFLPRALPTLSNNAATRT